MVHNKKESNKLGGFNFKNIANYSVLLLNIIFTICNIAFLISNLSQSKIGVIKEMPQFEVQYLDIDKTLYLTIISGQHITDSLSTDAIKNYQAVKEKKLNSIYLGPSVGGSNVVTLAIKQIGASIAKDVMVEYECVYSPKGLDFFVPSAEEISLFLSTTDDSKDSRIKREKYCVKYGDITTGRGLLLPLFEYEKIMLEDMSDYWSTTGSIVMVPKKLSYRNIYNDEVTTIDIRKMNDSPITISMYIEGRG